MFERFTKEAREVTVLSQEQARLLSHNYIGTEHVLLAMLSQPESAACQALNRAGLTREEAGEVTLRLLEDGDPLDPDALRSLGIDLDQVRSTVEAAFGAGALNRPPRRDPKGHIPFTPRAKKVLELALREALALKHNYIGVEHILLGLIREGEGVASKVMSELGVDTEALRREIKTGLAA